MAVDLDTSQIKTWRSIVTLVVFVFTNLAVLFPFHIPIFVWRPFSDAIVDVLSVLRITPPRIKNSPDDDCNGKRKPFVKLNFPINFVTAPLIADLFLLAILAVGRQEVYDGTIGANGISPIDVMLFFLSLAYIAISMDASGLIRYLAFKVLQWGGKAGHRLFFFLYCFFFAIATFIGNDPVILSGTAFLAYMTRVSSNIMHPRAWVHTQFAVANIASAILVSSNPTNLVLASAFGIKFINYTANIIVPVVVTGIVLFPFLMYIVFNNEDLVPSRIHMHELTEDQKKKKPVNPNIPDARVNIEVEENLDDNEQRQLLSLEEIMNPFLDKGGAVFGAVIMGTTVVTVIAYNAASSKTGKHYVFWVTLPAAFVMFCFDIIMGWLHRKETRKIARDRREEAEAAAIHEEEEKKRASRESEMRGAIIPDESKQKEMYSPDIEPRREIGTGGDSVLSKEMNGEERNVDVEKQPPTAEQTTPGEQRERKTLVLFIKKAYRWSAETFPTATAVLSHLPWALVPFALAMFVLVQGLVTKGWVPVFAYGWDHWVNKTGTLGAIGGMGFLSVILCNFAGTNIGTTILLCRVIQAWQQIHTNNGTHITNRTFWATVYSMALGVNYGAFSAAFSASLAGLLWRDILARKHIRSSRLDFARVNLPIIAIAMTVGCVVLVGEIYIMRDNSPYDQ